MNKLLFTLLVVLFTFGCTPKRKEIVSKNSEPLKISNNSASQAIRGEGKWWDERNKTILNRRNPNSELILIGNSIFHTLDNEDRKKVLTKYLDKYQTINIGISGDRTENVIWRLENGTLENVNPKVAVVLIGTNNTDGNHFLQISTPEELSEGIWKICSIINDKLPNTKIILIGILPYGYKPNNRDIINKATNSLISKFPKKNPNIHYVDISSLYYDTQAKVRSDLMPDYLHPNAEGHMLMFGALENEISKLMNE